MSNGSLHIRIISPEGLLYEGDVRHVNLPGELGNFSVYPLHAPIISTLKKGDITYSISDSELKSIAIQSGFVEVKNDRITACIEI